MGLFGVWVYNWSLQNAPAKTAFIYLAVRVITIIVSVLGALIYCIFDRKEAVVFLLTFAIIYVMYLIFETWFYYTFEFSQKHKRMNKE
jgi:uncharacterized membrane protein YqjE